MSIREVDLSKLSGGKKLDSRVFDLINEGHQGLAKYVLGRAAKARKSAAMRNPVYAAIEARRGERGQIYLSEELTIADWETQRRIEKECYKDPFYIPLFELLARFEVLGFVKTLGRSWRKYSKRLRGEIEDVEWYSLASSLCLRAAKQLEALADGMHGWPGAENGFDTPEEWGSTLRAKAGELRRVNGSEAATAALNTWYELACDATARKSDVEAAGVARDEIEAADKEAAKSALIWVAEHLDNLWD